MIPNLTEIKSEYVENPPTFEQVLDLKGATLLEFGTPWCEHCQAAIPAVKEILAAYPELSHLKVMDGKGKRLGRILKVKLWPTLILLRDGEEIDRVVRPTTADEFRALISHLAP